MLRNSQIRPPRGTDGIQESAYKSLVNDITWTLVHSRSLWKRFLLQDQALSAQKRAQRLEVELAEARIAREAATSEAAAAAAAAEQRIKATDQRTSELLAKAAAEHEAVCEQLKMELESLRRRESTLQLDIQETKDAVKVCHSHVHKAFGNSHLKLLCKGKHDFC